MKVADLPWCYPKVIGYVVDLFIENVQRFWVLGSGFRVGTANRRISNIEPQNVEGWNRFAQSFFYKIDRIHSFDIRYSLFDIRYLSASGGFAFLEFLSRFDWMLAAIGGAHMKLRQYEGNRADDV
jgi:hypothetical protein